MRLVIVGISRQRQEVYQRAFRWLVEKFKIGHKKETVHLTFYYQPPEHELGINPYTGRPGYALRSENGSTRNEIENGIVEMRINDYKCPDRYSECRYVTHPQMKTFIHEMVHVAQLVTGNLVRQEDQFGRARARWRGEWLKKIPAYDDMPWEHQANRLADQLFEPLRKALKEKVTT